MVFCDVQCKVGSTGERVPTVVAGEFPCEELVLHFGAESAIVHDPRTSTGLGRWDNDGDVGAVSSDHAGDQVTGLVIGGVFRHG